MPILTGSADAETELMTAHYDDYTPRFCGVTYDSTPEQAGPDEVNRALDRLLIADAMAQLSAEYRAVVRRSY